MEDKDIEQELKSSADKIEMKSFSERWGNIKERNLIEEGEQEVLAEDAVFATPEGTITRNVNNKKRYSLIAILSLIVCCIVILAIVLPITLKKNEMEFFDQKDLAQSVVSEEQFYKEIKNAKYDLIDLSKYDVNAYSLFIINDGEVKGGTIEIINEDIGFYLHITFYDKTVNLNEPILEYEKYEVNSIEVNFNTQIDEEIYTTYAYVEYKNLHYQIEYTSIEDNCITLFKELFA